MTCQCLRCGVCREYSVGTTYSLGVLFQEERAMRNQFAEDIRRNRNAYLFVLCCEIVLYCIDMSDTRGGIARLGSCSEVTRRANGLKRFIQMNENYNSEYRQAGIRHF